ncbi:MAG: hypothetical protein ACLUPF_00420 [Dorea sp.]
MTPKIGLIIVYAAMGIPMSFLCHDELLQDNSGGVRGIGIHRRSNIFFRHFFKIVLPLAKPGLSDDCHAAVHQHME